MQHMQTCHLIALRPMGVIFCVGGVSVVLPPKRALLVCCILVGEERMLISTEALKSVAID
jgi:hypothetical protein